MAQSQLTFPQGHPPGPTAVGGGGEGQAPAGAVRVLPRERPGSWWLRPRGRRSGRRRLSAFQELSEPAVYLLLRGPCGHRESASAAAAPGPGARPALRPHSHPSRCPPLRTCAALCDQLAWPLSDGVHGAEGPSRALLGRTPSPPRPPARGQVRYPPLGLALGERRGRGPFNGLRGAAGRGRARYTPPALKGPARLRGARGVGGAAALWETDPTRSSEAGAGLAGTSAPPHTAQGRGRGSVLGPRTPVRRAAGGQMKRGAPRAWARLRSKAPARSAVKSKEPTPLPRTGAGVLCVYPGNEGAPTLVSGCRASVKGPSWPGSWGLRGQR